jgi:hypothetical protein
MANLKSVPGEVGKAVREPSQKSGTQYPWFDLNDSIEVAKAAHDKGGGTCGRDLIAVALKYGTSKSGGFLARIYAAKQFGLIDLNRDVVSVTDRATRILHPVMPEDAHTAMVEAFLAIPLFQKIFEKFKGGPLPPEVGLQNLLKTEYKIVADRVKPALRVLLDSAEQAGFFKASGDRTRMIAPTGVVHQSTSAKLQAPPAKMDGEAQAKPPAGGGGDGHTGVHPALIAMLRELPRPGTEWVPAKKDRFMTAFRSIVDVIYPDPEVSP